MTIQQMRAAVHEAYSGNGWGRKVDNMSDVQVQAVYFSLVERGHFDKKKEDNPPKPEPKAEIPQFKPFIGDQISLF